MVPAAASTALRRHGALSAAPLRSFPEEWEAFGDEENPKGYMWERKWKLAYIDPGSLEFAEVEHQLLESMQLVRVVRIERIQHRLLWRRFEIKSEEMRRKCAGIGVADS